MEIEMKKKILRETRMKKKIIRGFTIHEVETKEGNGIDAHIDGDLTPNQVMCLCAWFIVNVMQDTNCDEDEYIYVADRIKEMILDNDDHFIKYSYKKACEASEAND